MYNVKCIVCSGQLGNVQWVVCRGQCAVDQYALTSECAVCSTVLYI